MSDNKAFLALVQRAREGSEEALRDLAREAQAVYEALSPEEKWLHRREQMISWVLGEMHLTNRNMTRVEVERIVDRMISEGKVKHALDGTKPMKSIWEHLLEEEKEFP